MDDLEERAWFVFKLSPTTRVFMPAVSLDDAIEKLRVLHYKGAPIAGYIYEMSCFCSRQDLVKSLLRPRGT